MDRRVEEILVYSRERLESIRNRLTQVVPRVPEVAANVTDTEVAGFLTTAFSDLDQTRQNLVSEIESLQEDPGPAQPTAADIEYEEVIAREAPRIERQYCTSFVNETLNRVKRHLDRLYNEEVGRRPSREAFAECDTALIAELISDEKYDDALKIIVKYSRDVDDVIQLSAAALDKAGGLKPSVPNKLKKIVYVEMCAKYLAIPRNDNLVTQFVDTVLYDGALGGRFSPHDFTDAYAPLQDLEKELAEDTESTNQNARRFICLLTRTLVPLTSIVLKITAVVALTLSTINPLGAGMICASSIALDSLNNFLRTRMVLDMLVTFMKATRTGACLNEVMRDNYMRKLTDVLLHEHTIAAVKVCSILTGGASVARYRQ